MWRPRRRSYRRPSRDHEMIQTIVSLSHFQTFPPAEYPFYTSTIAIAITLDFFRQSFDAFSSLIVRKTVIGFVQHISFRMNAGLIASSLLFFSSSSFFFFVSRQATNFSDVLFSPYIQQSPVTLWSQLCRKMFSARYIESQVFILPRLHRNICHTESIYSRQHLYSGYHRTPAVAISQQTHPQKVNRI